VRALRQREADHGGLAARDAVDFDRAASATTIGGSTAPDPAVDREDVDEPFDRYLQ